MTRNTHYHRHDVRLNLGLGRLFWGVVYIALGWVAVVLLMNHFILIVFVLVFCGVTALVAMWMWEVFNRPKETDVPREHVTPFAHYGL